MSINNLFAAYFQRNNGTTKNHDDKKRIATRFLDHTTMMGKKIGEMELTDLQPLDIEDSISATPSRTSGAGKRQVFRHLASIFNWIERMLRQPSPMKTLQAVKSAPRSEDYVMSMEEHADLITHLPQQYYKDLASVLMLTGARPSEITTATIEEWTMTGNGSGFLDKRKHKTAYKGDCRVIICNDAASSIIRQYIGTRTTGLIFPNVNARSVCMTWFLQLVQSAALKSGRTKPTCLYSFRHSFAVRNLENGTPIQQVAAWLGHSVVICERHYAHSLRRLRLSKTMPV